MRKDKVFEIYRQMVTIIEPFVDTFDFLSAVEVSKKTNLIMKYRGEGIERFASLLNEDTNQVEQYIFKPDNYTENQIAAFLISEYLYYSYQQIKIILNEIK